jgi:hypothetical protein
MKLVLDSLELNTMKDSFYFVGVIATIKILFTL